MMITVSWMIIVSNIIPLQLFITVRLSIHGGATIIENLQWPPSRHPAPSCS